MEAIGAVRSIETRGIEGPARSRSDYPAESRRAASEKGTVVPNPATGIRETTRELEGRLERIAEAMDGYMRSMQRNLKIQVHQATGNLMVKVISKEDGRTIREIPPEELLNLAAKMEEMMGVLFDENV